VTRQAEEFWLDVAYHLHIHPREQDRLTVREWDQAVAAVTGIREEAEKAKGR